MTNTEQAYQNLPEAAKKAWRVNLGVWALASWLVPAYITFMYIFDRVPLWFLIAAVVFALILSFLLVSIIPNVRWKQWRYRINEHEIDLEHGIFIIRRTLIPINRVQHVDTRQGPVLRSYNLADVVISTAATTHKIPALGEDAAGQARSEISTFARKAKEDV